MNIAKSAAPPVETTVPYLLYIFNAHLKLPSHCVMNVRSKQFCVY